MADDITLSAAVGVGATVAAKDDGSRKFSAGIPAVLTVLGDPDTVVYPVGGAASDTHAGPTAANPSYPHLVFVELWNGTNWYRASGDVTNGMDVDVTRLPALPAGTNNIGDVDVLTLPALPAGSNNIGDVDVASIAAGDNNIGNVDVLTLPALVAGTANIGDVDVVSQIPGTGATNLGKAIDAVGGATDTGVASLAIRDDALTALTPIDGDYVALRVDANGALWASLSAALPAGTNAIGKLAANSGVDIGDVDVLSVVPGFGATNLGKRLDDPAGASDTGVSVLVLRDDALSTLVPAETDYVNLRVNASGALWTVLSGVLHDSPDSADLSGPVKTGAKATTSLLAQTPVAEADRTNLYAGSDGVLFMRPHTSLEDIISERVTNTDGVSTNMAGAFAATASQRIYLTSISISNSSATFCTVDIRDGVAGAVLWTFPVPATGGVVFTFPVPLRFTANTALAYDVSAAITTVTISVSGFKSKT